MELTEEFITAVNNRDIFTIRIMLKDSLLIDKTFQLFTKMRFYAENRGVNFWSAETEEFQRQPSQYWTESLMNSELTNLVYDFTAERLRYCQDIIRKVYNYPASNQSIQANIPQVQMKVQPVSQGAANKTIPSSRTNASPKNNNSYHFRSIISAYKDLKSIMIAINTTNAWRYDDIDRIQKLSEEIVAACKKIDRR